MMSCNEKMRRKGYVMTWDAMLALIFVILVFVGLLSMEQMRAINVRKAGFLELYSTSEDAIETLNKMGILDEIVTYWSLGNKELANETATFYLEQIVPEKMGYRFMIGNDTICQNQRIMEGGAVEETKASRFVTGHGEGKSYEHVSRAWLLYTDVAAGMEYSIENVSYGRGFANSSGCEWHIEYLQDPSTPATTTVDVPQGYAGADICNYNSGDHSEPEGEDAVRDATYRLLDKIDATNDGILDDISGLYYDPSVMEFKTVAITNPSLSETEEVTLVLWIR